MKNNKQIFNISIIVFLLLSSCAKEDIYSIGDPHIHLYPVVLNENENPVLKATFSYGYLPKEDVTNWIFYYSCSRFTVKDLIPINNHYDPSFPNASNNYVEVEVLHNNINEIKYEIFNELKPFEYCAYFVVHLSNGDTIFSNKGSFNYQN